MNEENILSEEKRKVLAVAMGIVTAVLAFVSIAMLILFLIKGVGKSVYISLATGILGYITLIAWEAIDPDIDYQ